MLDPDVDRAVVQQHHGVHQHGRAIVLGGRRTRAHAAGRPGRGRPHTAVPVGRQTAVGCGRGGAHTGHRARRVGGRAAAGRGRGGAGGATGAPARIAGPAQQQREQQRSEV